MKSNDWFFSPLYSKKKLAKEDVNNELKRKEMKTIIHIHKEQNGDENGKIYRVFFSSQPKTER